MRRLLRPQRAHQNRILKLPINEPQELRINIISIEPHFVFFILSSRRRFNRPPIASTVSHISLRSNSEARIRNCLDLHATAITAEIERQASIAPDILLGHSVRLRFDLHFVQMVIAPSGAVASTYRALTYVDVLGEAGNCDCDGTAVAAGANRGVFCRRHVCLVLFELEYFVCQTGVWQCDRRLGLVD